MKYLPILFMMLMFLQACDSQRVFEDFQDLELDWEQDRVVSFEFEVSDTVSHYNLITHIRNQATYPYYNLYYNFRLMDIEGHQYRQSLEDVKLFHPQTGKPFGSGLGDEFDHSFTVEENFKFPKAGVYRVEYKQFMRQEVLSGVRKLGFRLEKVSEQI